MFAQSRFEPFNLFRRKVHCDQPVHTRLSSRSGKTLITKALNGVRITHHHNRRALILLTKFSHDLQNPAERHSVGERTLMALLNHNTLGHWIRKRHTHLQYIRPSRNQPMQQLHSSLRTGVTRDNVGHQRFSLAGLQLRKNALEAAHRQLYLNTVERGHGENIFIASAGEIHNNVLFW